MAENKTQETQVSALQFISGIEHDSKRIDAETLYNLMAKITNKPGKMWGGSIIGFGKYHYKYDSGREGDFLIIGFSPRKQNLSIYLMNGFEQYSALLLNLGKHKTSKACLYINRLEQINLSVLEEILTHSYQYVERKFNA